MRKTLFFVQEQRKHLFFVGQRESKEMGDGVSFIAILLVSSLSLLS